MMATIQRTGDNLFPVRIVVRDDRGVLRFSKLGKTSQDAAERLIDLVRDQPSFLPEIMQALNNLKINSEVELEVAA